MSTNIKLSMAQISKIVTSGGFLGSLLSKPASPLMKVAVPLVKNVLAPLGITAATSAIDAGIQKKIHSSGTTTPIISDKEMNKIMEIVLALEDSNILWKGVTRTLKNQSREQRGGYLGMLLGTLAFTLLENMLWGFLRTGYGDKKGKGIARAGYGKEWDL